MITNDSTSMARAFLDDSSGVQSTITIGTVSYSVSANYQLATDDWLVTGVLPGGVNINFSTEAVNHHFDFQVPIQDGAIVGFATSTSVGALTDALGEDVNSDASGTLHAQTSGLAWGIAVSEDTPPIPGDFNGDGVVDNDDFNIWRSNFGIAIGAGGPQGDANLDGAIDAADYVIWREWEGTGASSDVTSAVPEPSVVVFGMIVVGSMLAFRIRRMSPINARSRIVANLGIGMMISERRARQHP